MSSEQLSIDLGKSEHCTLRKMPEVEKFEVIDTDLRCGCGAIAEYHLKLDMINNGDRQGMDICPRYLTKYTQMVDRLNIFRG